MSAAGEAGARAAQMIHLRKIEKGVVPIIDPEEVKTMPAKKLSWAVRNHWWFQGFTILLFFLIWFASPFAFYYVQRYFLMQPDTLLFENTIPSVFSFFAGIGLTGGILLALYYILKPLIPDLDRASAYNSIIVANRIYWGEYGKDIPWERAITKKDVEKVKEYDEKSSNWILLVLFLIAVPVYYLCFTTYRNVTTTTWTESLMGNQEVFQLNQVEKVTANLTLVEETDDGETELVGKMKMEIFFQGKVEPVTVCNPECFYTQDGIKTMIAVIDEESDATFEANELKRFERDFLQKNKPYLLELHRQIEQR